jgi:hypothetical protein
MSSFPSGFGTLQFTFDRQLDLAYASASDINKTSSIANVVCITASDVSGDQVPGDYSQKADSNSNLREDHAFAKESGRGSSSEFIFQPSNPIQTIFFDVLVLSFSTTSIGKTKEALVCPNIRYCPVPVCKSC